MVQSTTRSSIIELPEDQASRALPEERPPSRLPQASGEPESQVRSSTAPAAPGSRRWRAAWPVLLVLACYVGLSFIAYLHAWTASTPSVIEPSGQDSQMNMWFIAWVPYAILHGHNPFFTVYGNYPFGVNLLTGTGEVLLGLIGTPITLIFGPLVSYNALLTLAMASSAFSGYIFARRFTRWRPAAFIAGLLYGFSPYMIGQGQYHPFLAFVPIPPLIFLVLYELLVVQERRASKCGALLALLVCVQYFISTEILADTVLVAGIAIVLIAVSHPHSVKKRVSHAAAGLGTAIALAVLALGWPTFYALNGPAHVAGSLNPIPGEWNRADLMGAIVPNQNQLIAPARFANIGNSFALNPQENGSYLGLPLIVILMSAVMLRRRRRVLVFSVVFAAFAFLLSLGSPLVVSGSPQWSFGKIGLPEGLLNYLPLLNGAEPARFALFVALFASLALAVVLDEIRYGRRTRQPSARPKVCSNNVCHVRGDRCSRSPSSQPALLRWTRKHSVVLYHCRRQVRTPRQRGSPLSISRSGGERRLLTALAGDRQYAIQDSGRVLRRASGFYQPSHLRPLESDRRRAVRALFRSAPPQAPIDQAGTLAGVAELAR